MMIVAACLLSIAAAVSGAGVPPGGCRACEKITAWKLYTSGNTTDWPIRVTKPPTTYTESTPGYFTRINNGTKVCESRTNESNWNIMMFTDPTYKATPCCGDTDDVAGDYIDLCATIRLFKQDQYGQFVRRGTANKTEIYWPWFFNGDDECPLGTFSENEATFDRAVNCNPSDNIYRSGFPGQGGAGLLLPGAYMLKGSTHNGCPPRPSGQDIPPTGAALDTSIVYFTVKAGC